MKNARSKLKKISNEPFKVYRKLIAAVLVLSLLIVSSSILFYFVYRNTLIDSLTDANNSMLEQTDMLLTETYSQIENMASQLSLEVVRLINKSDNDITHDYFHLAQLINTLTNLKSSHMYVHSAYVFFNQGNVIATSFMGVTSYKLFYDTGWYNEYRINTTKTSWLFCRKPYDEQYETQQRILMRHYDDVKNVHTLLLPLSESLRSRGGVIIINIYEEFLADLLSNNNQQKTFAIDNAGNIVISSDGSNLYTMLSEELHSIIESVGGTGSVILSRGGENMLYLFTPSKHDGLTLISEIPLSKILQQSNNLLSYIIVSTLIILLISVLVILMLYRNALKPVKKLYKILEENVNISSEDAGGIEKQIGAFLQDSKQLRAMWDKNRILIRHRTLSMLLSGTYDSFGELDYRLQYLDIVFPYDLYTCILISLDIQQEAYVLLNDEYDLIKMQLFPMINGLIPDTHRGYTVDIDDLHIGVILNFNQEEPASILQYCISIQSAAASSSTIPYTLSIGIGTCVSDISSLNISFQNACSAADFAKSLGGNEIISFSSISLSSANHPTKLDQPQKNIIDRDLLPSIRLGQSERAIAALSKILDGLSKDGRPFSEIRFYCINLCAQISSLLQDSGISPHDVEVIMNTEGIMQSKDEGMLFDRFTELLNDICAVILEGRKHKNADLIEQITIYVNKHYTEDITLSHVANAVYMSVPYLCKIFKEYMGKTFSEYLSQIRVDASVDRLLNSNDKIMDIAVSCGFTSVQTYIRAFKRHKNVTPSEYRAKRVSSNLGKKQ